ncbi:helix-turn-helix domain-containing protein [Kutzneria kofuensis]|uniref:Putative ArsR family transcriptional regulator n=1 Tax=Kutzneria kofuensis TaxID=103725 RepID=A0A7W9KR94_9PSEU|nr:helix-turn-helix domain-containing protein [Kutzneria kofuensis]MBB5897268.1 putative ArsR family transcriptional regulator [Kutzneria kofuensis]
MENHPVREALLELLRTRDELTSTDAARELGGNTGLYSFHLRKLAEQGLVEDVPGTTGRARPWRLAQGPKPKPDPELGELNRRLEDESYQRWRDNRGQAPVEWRDDEAFSEVVYLTPEEMAAMGDAIRSVIALFRHRETLPAARPADAAPVAVVARLFPMLDPE